MTAADVPAPDTLVERGLERARAAGTLDAAIVVEHASSTNLRWAGNQLTTNGTTGSWSVGVVAVVGRPAGARSAAGLSRQVADEGALDDLVADAVAAARSAPAAEDAADLVPGPADPGFAEPAVTTSPERLTTVAGTLGELFADAEAGERELFGFARHDVATTWLGTSAGVRSRAVEPVGAVELNGKSHGRTRSAWAGATASDPAEIDVAALDAEVRQGLVWQARRVAVEPGRHDAVLTRSATADLALDWLFAAGARAAHEGRSAFARPGGGTRVGERLTDVPVTVADDPRHPGLPTAPVVTTLATGERASVFDNGMPVPGTRYLDEGVLRALPSSRHTAALAGTPVAPPAGNVLVSVAGGHGEVADLVATTERGLLVTCLWYCRVVDDTTLLVTGLTRDGVYVVEGGEVVGATTNFRFNDSPVDLLRRVEAAGTPRRCLPREWGEYVQRAEVPPLRVAGFHLSSVSQAS